MDGPGFDERFGLGVITYGCCALDFPLCDVLDFNFDCVGRNSKTVHLDGLLLGTSHSEVRDRFERESPSTSGSKVEKGGNYGDEKNFSFPAKTKYSRKLPYLHE